MKRFPGVLVLAVFATGLMTQTRADEAEAKAVVDKAIKALGGEEKLAKVKAYSTTSKGKVFFGGNEMPFTGKATLEGTEKFRSEFNGELNGNAFQGVTVLNGDKAWRKFGEEPMALEDEALANEKRTVYLTATSVLLLPLNGKGFKLESAPDEKVGDKAVAVVKVTGPDKKDFTMYFDKETGLPLKQKATVTGFDNMEFVQETTFDAFKEFGGIKRATKITAKRDGEPFIETEVTDFKVLDKVDADLFTEPK